MTKRMMIPQSNSKPTLVVITRQGWMAAMAWRYCGRNYGSELVNAYMFHRRTGDNAVKALQEARLWVEEMSDV